MKSGNGQGEVRRLLVGLTHFEIATNPARKVSAVFGLFYGAKPLMLQITNIKIVLNNGQKHIGAESKIHQHRRSSFPATTKADPVSNSHITAAVISPINDEIRNENKSPHT